MNGSLIVRLGRLLDRPGSTEALLIAMGFLILVVFALVGSTFAREMLPGAVGILVGLALAYLATHPPRKLVAGFLFILWIIGAVFLALSFPASFPFPSDTGSISGIFIWGFMYGFGIKVVQRLVPSPFSPTTPEEERTIRKQTMRNIAIVGVPFLVLFALAFAVYVLLEYVVGPLVRLFA